MQTITQVEFKKAVRDTKNPLCHLKGFKGAIHDENGLTFWHQVDTDEFEYVMYIIDKDDNVYYMGSR